MNLRRLDRALLLGPALLFLGSAAAHAQECLDCHSSPGSSVTFKNGDARDVTVDKAKWEASVHGSSGLGCTDCHADIKEYPHATLTKDYDDTAALVASLDMVVCMQTAVAHLAGALGVPCWVCVPPTSQWRYGATGEDSPWYDSIRVIRQQKGEWNFGQIAAELGAHFRRLPRAAVRAA